MKLKKLLGIAAIIAVIGFITLPLAGCPEADDGGGNSGGPAGPAIPGGTSISDAIPLTESVWANGNIPEADGEQWFKFTATAATQYIHFKTGTLTGVDIQLYDDVDDEESTFGTSSTLSADTTYASKTLTIGSVYYIKVTPSSDGIDGSYKITFSDSTIIAIPLTLNVWADGSITATDTEQWFKFTATDTTQYIHFKTGTLNSLDIQLYTNESTMFGTSSTLSNSTTYISQTLTIDTVYYIKAAASANGSYRIRFSKTAMTAIELPTENVITIDEGVWTYSSVYHYETAPEYEREEQWFKFTATAETQYIHFYKESATPTVNIQMYDDEGITTGPSSTMTINTTSVSQTLTIGSVYYIKVYLSSEECGSKSISNWYYITFNKSETIGITLPTNGVITIDENVWNEALVAMNATSPVTVWYKFTATATTQYIHFDNFWNSIDEISIQLYDSTGLLKQDITLSSSTPSESLTLTNGNVYYLKILRTSGTGVRCLIAYNKTDSTDAIKIPLPTAASWETETQLTENTWNDGSSANSYAGIRWFKFTATAATQYIHINPTRSVILDLQLCDTNGIPVGGKSTLSAREISFTRTLTPNSEYYIRLITRTGNVYNNSDYSGIAFNKSVIAPAITFPASTITITEDTWANGNISALNDEVQWFRFTPTSTATHYIHFYSETMDSVYVLPYRGSTGQGVDYLGNWIKADSPITTTGSIASNYITVNSLVYFKVMPSNNKSGTYKISVSKSTTLGVPLPNDATTLTANKYIFDKIPATGGTQWYKFTATAATQSISYQKLTLPSVNMNVYDSNGARVGNANNTTPSSLTFGSVYYIKLTSSDNNGTYLIAVRDDSGPVTFPLPTQNVTTITTANVYVNGNIPTAGEVQWFKLTVYGNHYINYKMGTLNGISGYVVNSNGELKTNLTTSSDGMVNGPDGDYYILISPSTSTGTGDYMIGYKTDASYYLEFNPPLPTENITQLTLDIWANGNITTAGGEQWFKFTATVLDSYGCGFIYLNPGTLNDINIRLYNADGTNVLNGQVTRLYVTSNSNTLRGYLQLTVGKEYYFKVTPYNSSGSGTYKMAFSATSPAPASP